MITRIIKTILAGGLVYYAARRAQTEFKLHNIRKAAKEEMEVYKQKLKDVFERRGEYADMTDAERSATFDLYFSLMMRATKMYEKTL